MPKFDWGLSAGTVDDFDREKQFKPYQGPMPPNGVYKWKVVNAWVAAGTNEKNPQLRILLAISPRDKAESRYEGFTCMKLAVVSDTTNFQYVPFLDAIGASESDFTRRTDTDGEGRVRKIGKWLNNGKTFVAGQLEDNDYEGSRYPKKIDWVGALDEYEPEDEEEEFEEEEDEYEEEEPEEEYEEEEEEPEPPRKATRRKTTRR